MPKFELDPKFENLRRLWYSNPYILFNIIEQLKYRETVFLRKDCVHRCIKANASHYLKKNFDRYHFFSEPFNLYGSLGYYPSMPMFSFNRLEKRKEMDLFNQDAEKLMVAYDFLLDIDNPDIGHALRTLEVVMEHFRGVPYWIMFSGTKGFHLRVDYDDFPEEFKLLHNENLSLLFKRFAENFSLINGLDDIDYSIYDLRRIAKAPYSVVYPYYFIALPLSDAQLQPFNLREVSIKTQLPLIPKLKNRGVLKREGSPDVFLELIHKYTDIR